MKAKGYLFFHLNLAFSSIEEESRHDVIKKCYHPLLELSEKNNIPIGIELTGWTLKQINNLDPSWVKKLSSLIKKGNCELIGSGYCQIIGPLVPSSVNEWNQKIGTEIYTKLLNHKPSLALVNEMAFSQSLVNLYNNHGYEGLIMDGDNIKLALESEKHDDGSLPNYAIGHDGITLPVLWSDSMLFQKVQHFAHGDICLDDYMKYFQSRLKSSKEIIPIYSNDAEVFDYRPGRFAEERAAHEGGEWKRIKLLLDSIQSQTNTEIILPSEALKTHTSCDRKSRLTSASYPVPVKKQQKYNIARWAVTGRNDLWLNTMCHKIEKYLRNTESKNANDWSNLCELWASDLRTHITKKRWSKALRKMEKFLEKHKIEDHFVKTDTFDNCGESIEEINNKLSDASIDLTNDDSLLEISTKNIKLKLNLRRGLAIQSLGFHSHKMSPCIGTLPHGHFSSIALGADFYSGGVIAELPTKRMKITDLEKVMPQLSTNSANDILISSKVKTNIGIFNKLFKVSTSKEEITLSYSFSGVDIIGSVRLGIITLLESFNKDLKIMFANGGDKLECYDFVGDFDHSKPASTFVSSSRGLGATTGKIILSNHKNKIFLNWDNSEAAVLPMLQNHAVGNKKLSRIIFSLQEIDDTLKEPVKIGSFKIKISSQKPD